jgi:hypothetical protein
MKPRSTQTLRNYGLTEATFQALFETHNGCCAICGVSEAELEEKHQDWPADRVLHIDHEHGTYPFRIRGLLCKDCNYDLEAYILKREVPHPGNRGRSYPRNDPHFKEYLKRTAGPRKRGRTKKQQKDYVEQWLGREVVVTLTSGRKRKGMLSNMGGGVDDLFEIEGDLNLYRAEDFAVIESAGADNVPLLSH